MSSRVFQSVIIQMKEITDKVIGVIDADGSVLACSVLSQVGVELEGAPLAIASSGQAYTTFEARTFCVLGGVSARFE